MAISSGKLRQSIILLVVISIVGALLSIYFFVYIDTKEEEIGRRNFNALMKSAHNIQQKFAEYNTKNVTRNYLKYNLDYILEGDRKLFKRDSLNDSVIEKKLRYEIQVRDRRELALETLKTLQSSAKAAEKGKRPVANGQIQSIDLTLKFVFEDTLGVCLETDPSAEDKCKRKKQFLATSTIPVSLFVEPLLRNDIFNEYIIVSPSDSTSGFLVYEQHPLGAIDSLRAALKPTRDEITLNGVPYKIFRFPFTAGNYNWVLIGLQDRESYLNEARSFDLFLLYTILLLSFVLLLSLPLIKVVLISRNEKLNKVDVIMCGVSLLMGCFFLTILINQYDYHHLYGEDINHQNALDVLSGSIEQKFIDEVRAAYYELSNAEYFENAGDRVRVSKDTVTYIDQDGSACHYFPRFTNFENINWIDNSGMQIQKWATGYKATAKIDVAARTYFRQVRDGLEWQWHDDQKIVIESIRSWNNADYLAVISRASSMHGSKHSVIAIASSLQSVIHATLPLGYKFCIADQPGNVWFHSEVNKNLSENIFEECDLDPSINMILYDVSRKSVVRYENKKHHIAIKPLAELPLYLIVLKDLSTEDQSKAYVLQVTFVFLMIHFLAIMLVVFIIALTWKMSLKRHITTRSLDWLKPDEDRIKLYVSIALLNLVIAVLMILFAIMASALDEITILVLTTLYTLPIYFLSLNNQTIDKFLKPINQTLLTCIVSAIVILNVSFYAVLDATGWIWLYQFLLLILIVVWLMFASYIRKKSTIVKILQPLPCKRKLLKFMSLRTAYSLAFSSLCVIIGIIPVFEFHRHAFNLERIRNTMATQYQMAKHHSEKAKKGDIYLLNGMETIQQVTEKSDSTEDFGDFEKLTRMVSPVIDTTGMSFIKTDDGFYTYVENTRWFWHAQGGRLSFAPVVKSSDKVTAFQSTIQTYQSPRMMGVTMGIVGLVWLFVVSRYLTGRIFIFDVNRNLVEADLFIVQTDNRSIPEKDREQLLDPLLNNHLFIIGLPFSGERDYIDKIHPPEREKRSVIDFVELSSCDKWNSVIAEKVIDKKIEVIILDHFEYDLQNVECNNLKLVLMERLFQIRNKKIVILSSIHPSQLDEVYGDDLKSKERWNKVFSHFYNIYFPLQKEKLSKEAIMKEYRIDKKKWDRNQHYYEFIERECSHGLFLQNLKPAMYSLVDVANKNNLTIEELSDKVRSLAYTYYASIWSCCSKDERFLIYDLAEDGLVNIKNGEAIVQLIYKGIFIQRRTLTIMNRSFRNFVLAYVNPREIEEMRNETLSYGTWSRVKGPIIFILCIAVLFLLYTQRGISSQIIAFLSAIATAIPLIVKLLTFVENQPKPKDKQS